MHKTESPVKWLWDKLSQKVRSRTGDEADILFLPFGTSGRVKRPEDAYFFLSGKVADYDRGTQMPGTTVVESRDYKVGEGRDEDPAWQERTVGQHGYMLDKHLTGIKPCDFRTSMMDIAMFQERDDAFKKIEYKEAVFATGMFKHNLTNDKWELTDLGLAFFEENTSWGDYLASVGKLDMWANQLANCDENRLLHFIRKFTGDDDTAKPYAAYRTTDAKSHGHKGSALGFNLDANRIRGTPHDTGRTRGSDPALSVAGVDLMKALYTIAQTLPRQASPAPLPNRRPRPIAGLGGGAVDAHDGDMDFEHPGLGLRSDALAAGRREEDKDEVPGADEPLVPRTVYSNLVNSISPTTKSVTTNWTYMWAAYQLGRCILEPDTHTAVIAQVTHAANDILDGGRFSDGKDMSVPIGVIFELMASIPSMRGKDVSGGDVVSYAILMIGEDGQRILKPYARPVTTHLVNNHVVYTTHDRPEAFAGQNGAVELFGSLWNATNDYAAEFRAYKGKAGRGKRLTALGSEVKTYWAALRTLCEQDYSKYLRELQPGVRAFAKAILAVNEAKPEDVIPACQRFTQDQHSLFYTEQRALINEQQKRINDAPLGGRFAADMHRDQQERHRDHPEDDEPDIDPRNASKYANVYARTPALRRLLGDKNMHILYHRMVLAKARDHDHETIDEKTFIYLMSLVESIYEDDLVAASDKKAEKQRLEHDAELKVIFFLQECAWQRAFKLRRFLEIATHAALYDGHLSVTRFIHQATNGSIGLRDKIVTSEDALLQGLRDFSEEFIGKWHENLPQNIKDELAKLGAEGLAQTGGSSIEGLEAAINNLKPQPSRKGAAGGHGGVAGAKLSPEYIKDLLRNLPIDDGELVRWGLENDMWPIIGVFLLKPYGTWVMGQAFAMQGGGKVGYTFEGKHDFQLQDNAIRKMHVGHWTLWAKPIVIRAEGVAHGFNVTANGYVYGNENDFWLINDANHRADYAEGKFGTASVFPVPVRINRTLPNWVYDITNRFNKYLGTTPEVCKERSLEIWSAAWGWVQDSSNPLERPIIPHDDVQQQNTIVFQATQLMYDAHTQDLTRRVRGRGHWGEREYDGCGIVRRGGAAGYLQPVGGNGTSTVALIT